MIANNDIIRLLENKEAKSFISKHLSGDIAKISLKYRDKIHFNFTLCLQLMKVLQKSKKKLPSFFNHLLALTDRAYQQSSSENIAEAKAKLFEGRSMLDLTGGLGIDDLYFSKQFEYVHSRDIDCSLNELVRYNFVQLGIENIQRLDASAYDSIDANYDLIYLDPDRRIDQKRAIAISDLSPNVLELMPELKRRTSLLAIKMSPLFDIKEAKRQFKDLKTVYIFSEGNDVKEQLFVLDFKSTQKEIEIRSIEVGSNPFDEKFIGIPDILSYSNTTFKYLHVPKSAIVKSGYADRFMASLGATRISPFFRYTSDECIRHNGATSYLVISVLGLASKPIRSELKKQQIKRLNIVIKGTGEKEGVWHKKLGTLMGGDFYLFIMKGENGMAILTKLSSWQ